MFRFIIIAAIAGIALGQGHYNNDPKTAAIISEERYLSGDGKFGASYSQEDGINFKEETDSDGTRHGSYSYVDPTGERRTISYTAGKNGFQASGDHLPQAPPAPPQAAPQPQYQPQQQYQPPQQAQQYNSGNDNYDNEGQYDPRYNDPNFGSNQQSSYQPPAQPAYNPPQPAYNPPQHQQQQQQYQQPQQQYQQPQYNQQNYQQPQQQYTTQNPHRFQPPGKLSLNRTPDGFSYSFNKVK